MSNKFCLLIDGNWLLISRFSVISSKFKRDLPDAVKQEGADELRDLMAKSINVILNRFASIDNVILIADGGSWRKDVNVPSSLGSITYKGNREEQRKNQDFDWNYVFPTISDIAKQAEELGITVARGTGCEGDDQIWWWSRKLNADGVNCIIWSSDNDLKQLVQFDNNTSAFTVWYNDKNGIWISENMRDDSDDVDFFMKPQPDNFILEDIKRRSKSVNYINPDSIVMGKIIMGDSGDNIMPIIQYHKGSKTYGIGKKDCEKLLNELNINNLQDFFDKKNDIVSWLLKQKKYSGLGLTKENVLERMVYNIRMVWLNEFVYPESVLNILETTPYKKFDISYIKSNYRCLVPQSTEEIERLFGGAVEGSDGDDLPF